MKKLCVLLALLLLVTMMTGCHRSLEKMLQAVEKQKSAQSSASIEKSKSPAGESKAPADEETQWEEIFADLEWEDEIPEQGPHEEPKAEPSDEGDGKFASMEAYVASSGVQEVLESLRESAEAQGMYMDIYGSGNQFVYVYTFMEFLDPEIAAPLLEDGLAEQAYVFVELAESLEQVVDVPDPEVVVIYQNVDGTEICSSIFTPEG